MSDRKSMTFWTFTISVIMALCLGCQSPKPEPDLWNPEGICDRCGLVYPPTGSCYPPCHGCLWIDRARCGCSEYGEYNPELDDCLGTYTDKEGVRHKIWWVEYEGGKRHIRTPSKDDDE